jgi:hypothetical protein
MTHRQGRLYSKGFIGLRKISKEHPFGSSFASPICGLKMCFGEAAVGILILKVLAMWSLASLMTGFGLGAAIRRGERVSKDEFLSCLFASLETLQASRS